MVANSNMPEVGAFSNIQFHTLFASNCTRGILVYFADTSALLSLTMNMNCWNDTAMFTATIRRHATRDATKNRASVTTGPTSATQGKVLSTKAESKTDMCSEAHGDEKNGCFSLEEWNFVHCMGSMDDEAEHMHSVE